MRCTGTRTPAAVTLLVAALASACTGPSAVPSASVSPTQPAAPTATAAPSPSPTPVPELQVTIERSFQFRSSSAVFLWGYVYWTVQDALGTPGAITRSTFEQGSLTHVVDWGDGATSSVSSAPHYPDPSYRGFNGDPWTLGHDYGKTGTFQIVVTSKDAAGKTARGQVELVIGKGNQLFSFERADNCAVTGSGNERPALASAVGTCAYVNPGPGGRIEVTAAIAGGSSEHPIAVGRVWNVIRSGPGSYQMRANVAWKGRIGILSGVGGTRAYSRIAIHVIDTNGRDIVAPHVVDEQELTQAAVVAGSIDPVSPPGGKPVVFDFTIPRAYTETWRIELRVTCESQAGLISTNVVCSYDNVFPGINGFVEYSKGSDGYVFHLDKTLE